jgi:DNA-binding response OmpR family regulator
MLRALIVDEDADVGELLVYTLRSHGYLVTRVRGPQYAIQQCEIEQPDVVLLDPVLPWSVGLALCRRIRKMVAGPIIMVTTRSSAEDVREGFAAGADEYIVKPFSPQDLLSRVASVRQRGGKP